MANIKPGDVVQLRSGGVKMTVQEDRLVAGEGFLCAWFDGTTLCQKCIPEAVLRVAGPSSAWLVALIGGGALSLLLLLGVIVVFKNRDGEEVARIQVPDGGTVEVRQRTVGQGLP